MTGALDVGVELLDRSLAYSRVALAEVRPWDLTRPTPCTRWDLGALLAHLDDALAAFLEAAGGSVSTARPAPAPVEVARVQDRARALLGVWSGRAGPGRPDASGGNGTRNQEAGIEVGGLVVEPALVTSAAALEVTVHGWDVATALGLAHPVPPRLAEALLPLARDLAPLGRFAPPLPEPDAAAPGVRLLALLGREG